MLKRLARFLFRFRYKVKVVGLEQIKEAKGCLVLANHVSLVDPVMVYYSLACLDVRPVVTQTFFDMPPFDKLFKILRAISAPNFIVGTNLEKKYQLEESLTEIIEGLKAGDNILFYPAGRLKVQEEERVEGSSGLYRLLQKEKKLAVILVRTTGLWGSIFSTALHGRTPTMTTEVMRGFFYYLANLLLLTPKREVEMVVEKRELCLEDFPSKRALNLTLESWYNQKKDVFYSPPYHFLFRKSPYKRIVSHPPVTVCNQEILLEVQKIVEQIAERSVRVTEHLAYDLSFDSLQYSSLITLLEEKYGLTNLYTIELITCEHIAALIERSWVPNRLTHELHKQQRKIEGFKKKKCSCFDQLLGPVTIDQIGGQIEAFKEIFQQEVSETIPLFLGGGIESYSAYIAAHLVHKKPLFVASENVDSYPVVYTSKETIVHWNNPSLKHPLGTFKYLPYKVAKTNFSFYPCSKDEEAAKQLKDKELFVNLYFTEDTELFVSMTNVALRNKIPVILPFTGVRNTTWVQRVSAYLNHEIR